MHEKTQTFKLPNNLELDTKSILKEVYNALDEKGYNPIDQIVGYLLSEDPTYITTYNNARSMIRRIDRDELLQELVIEYIKN
ncbi:MAG: IreB family regulatory phosphoprotein [Clostridia bacterium]|nr:IreB family regulatory phosphoprotein [Clostridia bacterium]